LNRIKDSYTHVRRIANAPERVFLVFIAPERVDILNVFNHTGVVAEIKRNPRKISLGLSIEDM